LTFESEKKTLKLSYHPETVASDVLQLICRVVTFTPQNQKVVLKVFLIDEQGAFYLKLLIENTGVNISRVGEITKGMRNAVKIYADDDKSTGYEILWHLEKPIEVTPSVSANISHPPDNVRGFYAAIRNRMSAHFKKEEKKMALLASENPKEAIFLQKVMAIVNAHMDDETFDVEQLARSLAMSRMHLHRRLKPLVNLSPAHYIRDRRLIKAKELIEKEDLSIGEICFKVGFQSQSHFTRAFVEKFGVRPTAYRKGK
jgi:AraC-like DNA-binding protein